MTTPADRATFAHLYRFAEQLRDKAVADSEYEAASVACEIMGEIKRLAREVGIEI